MTDPAARRSAGGLPATIGRYRVSGRIGKGAMGIVYKARDEQIGRDVAVKVLMADLESESDLRARFFREAQVTSKLLHRNIVTVFDMGEDDGRLFIVMEMLRGRTLAEYLVEAARDVLEEKLDLMIQTCDGLAVAHAKGVVHRDVKPGNLFVQTDGGLKILDFGVARLASSNMTASGLIVGTPDYMSPEQARGKEVDARSDVFSAAAVFYLMVTGRKPFAGPDLPVVLHKVVREDPPPIEEVDAPAALARIILRALHKEPDHRYQTANDLAADLVRFRRQFDAETRQMGVAARERFDEINRVAQGIREARTALESPVSAELEVQERLVRERFPFFATRPDGSAPALVPFRRRQVIPMSRDMQATLGTLAAELSALGTAREAAEEAERALAGGDAQRALSHFDRASSGISIESARIARGRALAVTDVAQQQARIARLRATSAEARDFALKGDWNAVIRACADLLALDPQHADALALSARARAALASATDDLARRVSKLVRQAEFSLRDGGFDRAEELLTEALALDSAGTEAQAMQARVREARIASDAREKTARLAADAVRAARQMFHAGNHDGAIEQLTEFARQYPGATDVAMECERLRGEAARLAAEADRRLRAKAHADDAEKRWQTGDASAALASAELALHLEPGHARAQQIQDLARTRLREQAAAARRQADADARTVRAAAYLSKGQFAKAAREAQRALDLDARHPDALRLLADVRRQAGAATVARHREAALRARERQVDRMLRDVRSALKAGEPTRALYTAEDAVRLDPGHLHAREWLERARAAVEAAGISEDSGGTAQLADAGGVPIDPDDTAVLRRHSGGVRDLAISFGDWAARLKRRLQSPRGQATTVSLIIAGALAAALVVLGQAAGVFQRSAPSVNGRIDGFLRSLVAHAGLRTRWHGEPAQSNGKGRQDTSNRHVRLESTATRLRSGEFGEGLWRS